MANSEHRAGTAGSFHQRLGSIGAATARSEAAEAQQRLDTFLAGLEDVDGLYIPAPGPPAPPPHPACQPCSRCPECRPLHERLLFETAVYERLAGDGFGDWSRQTARIVAEWRATADVARAGAQATFDEARAENSIYDQHRRGGFTDTLAGTAAGIGLDPSKVSFVPREGWIETQISPSITVWLRPGTDVEEVRHSFASSAAMSTYGRVQQLDPAGNPTGRYEVRHQGLQALLRDMQAAQQKEDAAAAALRTATQQRDAQHAAAAAWADQQFDLYQQLVDDQFFLINKLQGELQDCFDACAGPLVEDDEDPEILLPGGTGTLSPTPAILAAATAIVAGVTAVLLGQPFDTGSMPAGQDTTVAEPVDEVPADDAPAVEVPAVSPDEVQLDLAVSQTVGLTAYPDDDLLAFLDEPGIGEKFLVGDVSPTYFTSFFAEPLADLDLVPGAFGDTLTLDGHLTSVLRFEQPVDVGEAISRYADQADLAFLPAAPAEAADALVAVGLTIDGDLTDPATCAGREHTFAFIAADPSLGSTYVPNPSFPGDYFLGGNRFSDFTLQDCQPSSGASQFVGEQLGPATNGGGALVTVADGRSSALFLLPAESVPVDGDLRTVYFEALGDYGPETTRYQAVPDQFTPAASMATAMDTGDCHFVLVAPPPLGAPSPSPTAPEADEASPSPSPTAGPTEDAGGGGGGLPPTGGGAPTPGTGTSVAGGGGDPTVADPDETSPLLVGLGAALAALGAAGLALAGTRREEDDRGDNAHRDDGRPAGDGPQPAGVAPTARASSAMRARPDPEERRLPGPARPPRREATDAAVTNELREQSEQARIDHRVALEDLRSGGVDDLDLGRLRRDLLEDAGSPKEARKDATYRQIEQVLEHEATVRRAAVTELTMQLGQLPEGERAAALRERLAQLREDVAHLQRVALDRIAAADDRTSAMARWEADLRSRRIQLEVARELMARLDPATTILAGRLGQLAERLSGTNIELEVDRAARGRGELVRRFLELQRLLDLSEYRRIAQLGTFTDPLTGERLSGQLRQQVGAAALETLAELLAEQAWAPKFLTIFHHGDDREELARRIDREVARDYGHLDVIGPGPIDPKLYYRGVIAHLRRGLADLERWYQEQYLSQGDNWFSMALNMGFGSWLRHVGEYFHDDPDEARKVIDTITADAEAAIAALELAAGEDGEARLREDAEALALLESAGYARRGDGGTVELVVPDGPNRLQLRMRPLPGRSMLDIFSARTVTEIGLAGLVPGWAGAGFARTAAQMGTEVHALRAMSFMFEAVVGAYAETGIKVLLDGDVSKLTLEQLRKLVTESLVNNAVSAGGNILGRGAADRLEVYRRAANLFRHADPAVARARRALAERIVREGLEMVGEASLTTLFNAVANGKGLTYEEFLANALASTLNKAIANGHLHPENLSPELRRAFGDDGTAALADVAARHADVEQQRAEISAEQRAEALARYDAVTDNATHPTPEAIFLALLRGDLNWSDMKIAMQDRPGAEDAQRVVASMLRKELINGALPEARARARETLLSDARDRRRRAMELPDGPERRRALEELRGWFGDELSRIDIEQASGEVNVDHSGRGEDVIVPGSDKPDSDVDLSVRSEYMRRALAEVMQEHITARIAELGGEAPAHLPTLARSLDTNFYYNVMERIPSLLRTYETIAELPFELRLVDGSTVTLPHAQVVEANSFALVMRNLDEAGRARYERNMTEGLSGEALTARRQQLQLARDGLERSRRELEALEAGVRQERGPDADPLDVQREAEDRLYGRRMQRLHELEQQLDVHPLDDPVGRARLRAQWEQQLNTIKRDGIETYGDAANLMIVVVMVQMGFGSPVRVEVDPSLRNLAELQSPDGPARQSIPELMQDPDWRLDGRLGEFFTRQQIDAMIRDQYLMLIEHANEFQHGHEDPVATMRAFFKYGERVFLGLSMKGEFVLGGDNSPGLQAFWDTIAGLSKDPAALRARLEQLGEGDLGMGMRLVLERFSKLPEMEGLLGDTSAPLGGGDGGGSVAYDPSAAGRAWAGIKQAAHDSGGTAAVDAVRTEALASTGAARAEAARALAARTEAARYRPEDRRRAAALRTQLDAVTVRLSQLPRLAGLEMSADPGAQRSTRVRNELLGAQQRLREQLDELARIGPKQPAAADRAEIDRLRRRVAHLDATHEAVRSSPTATRATTSAPVRPSVAATDRAIDALTADLAGSPP